MWIKSLKTEVWINMSHITYFRIVGSTYYHNEIPLDEVYAFLDTSANYHMDGTEPESDQASLIVYQGTYEDVSSLSKSR